MLRHALLTCAVVPLALVLACGGDDDDGPTGPQSRTITLNQVGGNGVTGTATITPESGGTTATVVIQIQGFAPNSQHAGHVHRGSCANQGPIDVTLNPVTAGADGRGTSTTTGVQTTFLTTGYYFQYHVALQPPGAGITCGDISAASASSVGVAY